MISNIIDVEILQGSSHRFSILYRDKEIKKLKIFSYECEKYEDLCYILAKLSNLMLFIYWLIYKNS